MIVFLERIVLIYTLILMILDIIKLVKYIIRRLKGQKCPSSLIKNKRRKNMRWLVLLACAYIITRHYLLKKNNKNKDL